MKTWERMTKAGSIVFFSFILKTILDLGLNSFLLIKFGYWVSLVITSLIYAIIGFISVRIYDKRKIDYLMIEALKESLGNEKKINAKKSWFKRNTIKMSMLFSIKNTGLIVILFRNGFNSYDGFNSRKIILIFIIYSLYINLCWNTVAYSGISFIELVIKMLKTAAS